MFVFNQVSGSSESNVYEVNSHKCIIVKFQRDTQELKSLILRDFNGEDIIYDVTGLLYLDNIINLDGQLDARRLMVWENCFEEVC